MNLKSAPTMWLPLNFGKLYAIISNIYVFKFFAGCFGTYAIIFAPTLYLAFHLFPFGFLSFKCNWNHRILVWNKRSCQMKTEQCDKTRENEWNQHFEKDDSMLTVYITWIIVPSVIRLLASRDEWLWTA